MRGFRTGELWVSLGRAPPGMKEGMGNRFVSEEFANRIPAQLSVKVCPPLPLYLVSGTVQKKLCKKSAGYNLRQRTPRERTKGNDWMTGEGKVWPKSKEAAVV